MSKTKEDACLFFYKRKHITPKEMTNLVLGNDPRERSLTYRTNDYQSIIEKITYKFKCKANTALDSKVLFEWVMQKIPEFKTCLPVILRSETHLVGCAKSSSSASGRLTFGEDGSFQRKYCEALYTISKLEHENSQLTREVERLLVFEKKAIKKKENCRKGGLASRGKRKNFH